MISAQNRDRRMRLFAAAGISVACLVAACATGGGDSAETTSVNGVGGTGGTVSMGGMGGMPNVGGMGGSPPACSEDPCKLTAPQCGCLADQKCTWTSDEHSCVKDGEITQGEKCGIVDICEAGTHCLGLAGLSICRSYCTADSECNAPGGLCVLQATKNATETWDQKWCSDNCDPASGVGCAAVGSKCELSREQDGQMRYFTLCLPAGSGTQQSPCPNGFEDCANGYGCIGLDMNMQPICLQWCNVDSPQCGTGTCTNFQTPVVLGSVTYGACL